MYDAYVLKAENALGLEESSASYIRLFDITIVDEHGEKVVITAPVDVSIELADKDENPDTKVIHFADGADDGDIIENVENEGDTVCFEADGFSAYAIVEGPKAIELGWSKVNSLDELNDTGFYIGHIDGYYFKDTINSENSRLGITKTKPAISTPASEAVLYYFEKVSGTDDQFYVYCMSGTEKKYVFNNVDKNLSFAANENEKTAFTISVNSSGVFEIRNVVQNGNKTENWYWNMQGGADGKRFCSWNKSDANTKLYIWNQRQEVTSDPYELNGKSYGLMNWNGGVSGRAMMAGNESFVDGDTEQAITVPAGSLGAMSLTVMARENNHTTKLFVPRDMLNFNVSMWTFEWSGDTNLYYLKTADGRYLTIGTDGLSLTDTKEDNCKIQVVPGTGVHEGQSCLKSTSGVTLTYSGAVEEGFSKGGEAGNEYLYLIDPRENTQGYIMTYSASKVSVSDLSVTTGKQVVVYTRFWVEGEGNQSGHYDYYAINSKGQLIPCYERGDSIEWVSGPDNDMLWQFTQYCEDDGTWKPYCELENTTSHKFIAPSATNDSILSDTPVGIILSGRRNGQYYTPILTWDQGDYHYTGMRPASSTGGSGTEVIPCSIWDAEDFYFAVMEDIPVDDKLNTVNTIDNELYGITMKMVNLTNSATNSLSGQMNAFFNNTINNGLVTTTVPDLLSSDIPGGEHGYPTAYGGPLSILFNGEKTVNHLFIESTYHASGYFEYDSTQNFASLNGGTDFTVYKELGTTDQGDRGTLKHGQFFPYDEIEAGRFASVNKENLYTPATNGYLPDSDPRKYEQLYLIKNQTPDYYFGMELDAGFDQTPSGEDAWGHDIIFEFSGDDDFWLYVDGELVIDLGGIHSAVPGSVNFKTGIVNVNGTIKTLREVFEGNYRKRNPNATDAEVSQYLADKHFAEGENIFENDTHHTMRIFYFERGAGASNLHMRFNLATVKKGSVQLTKKLGGLDTTESSGAKFAYQIIYKKADGSEHYLTNTPQREDGETGSGENGNGEGGNTEGGNTEGGNGGSGSGGGPNLDDPDLDPYDRVCYKETHDPVEFKESAVIDGVTYEKVFFIVPGDKGTADITFPEDMTEYRIIECGVNTDVYYQVKVNDLDITENGNQEYSPEQTYAPNRKDFGIGYDTTKNRPKVIYENYPQKENLQIRKRLWFRREGEPVEAAGAERQTSASFNFRLYFGTEFDDNPNDPAYIYEYHVKDLNGDYCRRDKTTDGQFIPIDPGKAYNELTSDQKRLATFNSGTGGSISEIPAYYTVEIRDVLVGSPFRIAELDSETADGFEYWRYAIDEYVDEPGAGTAPSPVPPQNEGVTDTIENGKTSLVYVDNLKGFGLRLNKVWADANDMQERDSAYFAVFIKDGNGHLTYVADSLKELPLKDSNGDVVKQTLYWFYEKLPQNAGSLSDIVAREVTLPETEGGEPIPVADHGYIELSSKHTHSETPEDITYKVTYDEPVTEENVSIFGVTNTPEMPYIVLKKMKWDGETPLADANFTLSAGSLSDSYISGSDGGITTLYPMIGTEYTLTETSAPAAWQGAAYPIRFSMDHDGKVTVTTENGGDWYKLTQAAGNAPAELIVKNRPFTFKVVKKDGQTGAPIKNVSFELFHYVQSAAGYVPTPMGGEYAQLKTDDNGLIPKLNEGLPADTYQLREQPPQGYQHLSQQGNEYTSYITFRIDEKGVVTLTDNNPEGISLSAETDDDDGTGTLAYTLTILNYPEVKIIKTDESGRNLKGAKFCLNRLTNSSVWEVYNGGGITNGVIDLTANASRTIAYLPDGRYQLVEEKTPEGYIILTKYVYFTVERAEGQQLIWLTDEDGSKVPGEEEGTYSNIIGDASLTVNANTNLIAIRIKNHQGAALPYTGGPGTRLFTLLGVLTIMIAGTGLYAARKKTALKKAVIKKTAMKMQR